MRRCRRIALGVTGAAGLILLACTNPVGSDRLTPERLPVVRRIDSSVAVAKVTSQEKEPFSLDLEPRYWIGDEEFGAALADALTTSGLFRITAPGSADFELRTHVVSQQWQQIGATKASATLVVSYRLKERSASRQLWHHTFVTTAVGEGSRLGQGLSWASRQALARAAQRNLTEMLKSLSEILP